MVLACLPRACTFPVPSTRHSKTEARQLISRPLAHCTPDSRNTPEIISISLLLDPFLAQCSKTHNRVVGISRDEDVHSDTRRTEDGEVSSACTALQAVQARKHWNQCRDAWRVGVDDADRSCNGNASKVLADDAIRTSDCSTPGTSGSPDSSRGWLLPSCVVFDLRFLVARLRCGGRTNIDPDNAGVSAVDVSILTSFFAIYQRQHTVLEHKTSTAWSRLVQ